MAIKAKFSGHCRICGGRIYAGEKIKWSRDLGARHIQCDDFVLGLHAESDNRRYTGDTLDSNRCQCEDYPCCGH